ncbi:hypothetical protein C8R45DRAFT_1096278 [Mycena sanguinolenta]|nr:hypothetical protein C8R45DRAFT_1096278 [Mycena sanguinolenta]
MPRPFLPYHDVPSRSLLTPIHYDPRTARGTQMTMEKWEMGFEWLLTWGHALATRFPALPGSAQCMCNLRTTQHATLRTLYAHAMMGIRAAPLRSPRASVHAAHGLARTPRCALLLVPMSMHGVLFALTAPADERARWNNVLRAPGLARYARGRTQPTYSQYM